MQPSTLAKRGSLLLFLALTAFYFYGLGHLPLVGPDEPRYAQVAREMFIRHDLITPTLGGHLWFEKPSLLYWMMMASFKLFGVSEWSARLPSAVSGLLTIAAVYFIGRRAEQGNRDEQRRGSGLLGFWSALAAGTSLGIVVFSKAASFDIVVTMTTTWALAFFIVAELEETARLRRRFLAGFYIFVGLSLLAKGLIGIVIPFGVVGAYYVFRRRWPERKTLLSFLWGVPLACCIAATWYGPVILRHGWPFIDQFFIQHHFARYLTNKYHHSKPVYYYLLVVPLLSLPWTAFLISGFLKASRKRWRTDSQSGEPAIKLRVFALAWLLLPLIFFSFSNSKLPGYILPVLPAVALIVGEQLRRLDAESGNTRWALRATAVLCLLFAIVVPVYARSTGKLSVQCALMIAAPLVVAGGFTLFATRRRVTAILLLAAATLVALVITLHCAAPQRAERESSKRLIELANARGYSQAAIYGVPQDDRTPEFYAAGRVVYGASGDPVTYADPSQIIIETYKHQQPILVFVPLKQVNELTGVTSLTTDVIGNNGRFAIVAVRSR